MPEEKRKLPKGIRKRGNRYEGRVQYEYHTYCVYGDTISEVKKKMTETRYKLEHGGFVEKEKVSLDDWFEKWLKEYKEKDIKKGTIIAYQNYYNYYVKKKLGRIPIASIRGEHIQELYNQLLEERLSLSSLKVISAVLSGCFKRAYKNGLIERNPVELAELPRKKRKEERRVLTADEQELFMKYAQDSYLFHMFALLLRTGMRSGEVRGLKYNDVDRSKKVIHIRRTLKYESGYGFFEDEPKTGSSIRDIPLSPEIEAIIEEQKRVWQKVKVVKIDEYIFHIGDGTPVSRERLQGEIDRIIKRMEQDDIHMERFTPHCFRHTFATRAIENGMKPQILKNILGHSSLSMTMDLYSHVLPDKKAEEMDKIQSAFQVSDRKNA